MNMLIAEMRIHPYRIPFRQPFATAHGTLAVREGAIVELVTEDGIVGVGDMAAVTEFGAPDVATLMQALRASSPAILGRRATYIIAEVSQAARHERTLAKLPAPALFALETAARDVVELSHDPARSIRRELPPVPVNATIGSADRAEARAAAQAAVAEGMRGIKLKVGMLDDAASEIERIRAVRAAIAPDVLLRLDANEAWTVEQATEILSACQDLALAYVEQPVARDDLAGMRAIRERIGVRIAADEAITDFASVQRVLEAEAADVVVLKPQLLGGIKATGDAISSALKHGASLAITTVLESGIGVAMTLIIAQTFQRNAVVPLLACGLATLPLLEDDLILDDLPIRAGMMALPDGARNGVTLDRAALDRYRLEVPG
jgi:o-succinylbenzoate synthase